MFIAATTVSARFTLLPVNPPGALEYSTWGRVSNGLLPSASAFFRSPSKLTERARKYGVLTLAMSSLSARWRADYNEGLVLVESRNLERLGNHTYKVDPAALGQEIMDEFGHLVLGQPSRFREFCRY